MQRAGISTIWLLIFTLALLGGLWTLTKTKKADTSTPATITTTEQTTDFDGAVLTAVAGQSGKGTAVRNFDGKTFTHRVMAELPPPPSDTYYQAWLSKDADSKDVVATGKLEDKNSQYELTFTENNDYSLNKFVLISIESNGQALGKTPSTRRVLEGKFQ